MQLDKIHIEHVVDVYLTAWVQQDPQLIETIFAADASYQEGGLAEPIFGLAGIQSYWQKKVVESQANIDCKHLTTYIDGKTAIVEWEAQFDDLVDGFRKNLREIAILEFDADRISMLREYWSSQKMHRLDRSPSD